MNKEELIDEILNNPYWQGGDRDYLRSLSRSELKDLVEEGELVDNDMDDYDRKVIMEQKAEEDLEDELASGTIMLKNEY